ncbi:MAG: site-specific integrase [Acutalibacter sp.]|nr:site-specific integrase [Acutalibacter sp.]
MKKRKDGRYQKKVTLASGKQIIVYGRTIAEVTQAADELRMQDKAGLVVGDSTTLGEWAKIWFVTYKANLRSNTLNSYLNAYNVHIGPYLAAMKLKDLRPVNIREIMQNVSGLSESLQHKVLITMRQLFTTARQNGLIVSDPTDGIKITPHSRPKRKEYLTLEEQNDLISALANADPRARCFVGLCLYCGLRREEAFGVQWGDISDGKLTVNRAITFLKNNQPDPNQELKTKASHRTIPIPSRLLDILQETPHIGMYLVTCSDGRPITGVAFRNLWDKVKKLSPCEVRPHMLRHSYATNLYRAGIDLKTAQYLLGHSSIQMTANIYTHIGKEDALSSIVQLEQYLSGSNQETEDLQEVVKK